MRFSPLHKLWPVVSLCREFKSSWERIARAGSWHPTLYWLSSYLHVALPFAPNEATWTYPFDLMHSMSIMSFVDNYSSIGLFSMHSHTYFLHIYQYFRTMIHSLFSKNKLRFFSLNFRASTSCENHIYLATRAPFLCSCVECLSRRELRRNIVISSRQPTPFCYFPTYFWLTFWLSCLIACHPLI